MIIEPRVRGFICTTAHPVGCASNVSEQIAYVLGKGAIPECPRRVAVLGCSTGYGLASRIVATFAGGAETIGVSLEREPTASRTGSAGWYNNRVFEIEAQKVRPTALPMLAIPTIPAAATALTLAISWNIGDSCEISEIPAEVFRNKSSHSAHHCQVFNAPPSE